MMEEVEKFLADTEISISYRTINIGGKFLYIEGIKNIINLQTEEMSFQLKKQVCEVLGKNLKVKYLDKTTCTIEGEIISVTVK